MIRVCEEQHRSSILRSRWNTWSTFAKETRRERTTRRHAVKQINTRKKREVFKAWFNCIDVLKNEVRSEIQAATLYHLNKKRALLDAWKQKYTEQKEQLEKQEKLRLDRY